LLHTLLIIMVFQPEERELELQLEARESMVSDGDGATSPQTKKRRRVAAIVAGVAAVLAVCGIGAVGSSRSSGMQVVQDEPALIEAIDLTAPCNLAIKGFTPVINDKLSSLQDPDKDAVDVTIDGPEITIICKAKTYLIFKVEEVTGLSSGRVAASCDDADLKINKVSAEASAKITFSESLVFTFEVKEKGSFCHVPHSFSQKITVTVSDLSVSTDVSMGLKQGIHTTVTSASISNLKIDYDADKSGIECDGTCDKDSSFVVEGIRAGIQAKITGVIESNVNDALAYAMPMTV